MSQEIVTTTGGPTALSEQIEFVRMVTGGEGQSILPDVYRGNPANALVAVGLGASMGLSPAESLYRISVIKGKPSAGAELIASNVRKAGHKLRVVGNESSCTATIIRADDPEFPFVVTRDMAWAKGMGLANNDNYKKQPGTMLQWRAITAVARLACPEALYGVVYTPEELTDFGPAVRSSAPATPSAPAIAGRDWASEVDGILDADALRALYRQIVDKGEMTEELSNRITTRGQKLTAQAPVEEVVDAEIVEDTPGRDWIGEIAGATTADALRALYKDAKDAGAPEEVVTAIADMGRELAAQTVPEATPPVDPEADAAWMAGNAA